MADACEVFGNEEGVIEAAGTDVMGGGGEGDEDGTGYIWREYRG